MQIFPDAFTFSEKMGLLFIGGLLFVIVCMRIIKWLAEDKVSSILTKLYAATKGVTILNDAVEKLIADVEKLLCLVEKGMRNPRDPSKLITRADILLGIEKVDENLEEKCSPHLCPLLPELRRIVNLNHDEMKSMFTTFQDDAKIARSETQALIREIRDNQMMALNTFGKEALDVLRAVSEAKSKHSQEQRRD